MTLNAIINILSWCGYKLVVNTTDSDCYKTTFYSNKYEEYSGSECAIIETSIRHAASVVVKKDMVVAVVLATATCEAPISSYKSLIEEMKKGQ